jgi:PAS domain S-box-containing protein
VTAGIWSRYAEVIETGHSAEFVHHFEGDRINAWLHVLAVKLGDGLMVEWRDVSREKEQQRRIEDSRNELELFNRLAQPFLTVTDPRRLFGQLQATLASEFGATAAVVGFIEVDGALALPAAGDQDGPRLWPKAEWQARWGEAPTAAAQIIPGPKDFPTALEPVAGQIAAPITLGGEVLGRIWLAPGTAGFTQSAGEQLERICQHLAGPFRAYLTEQRFNALRDRALALALENEAKFAAVFDHSLDALLLVEANSGQIVDCNAQAVSLFEAGSPERLIGTEGRLLAKNPRTPEAAVELRRQIAGGAGYEGDFEYRSLAGSVFWGHVAGRQMQLRGTDLQLFRITDISQRKAADQRLEAQATFRQQLIDSVPLPIFVKDTAGRYLECNRALSDFLGVSREQLLGKTVADVFTPDMAFEYQRRDEELLLQQQGLQIHRGQVRNAANEDRTVIFHRAAFQQGQGSLGGLIGTFIDVTDMDAASDRLRLQETALNAAASGLVITDRAGLILWANPAFSQLTGYTSEELAGKSTRLLRSGEQDAEFYHNLWQTITSGHVWRGELVNRRKDGSFYHEEMSITPVRGADGSIANFIAIKQDISARKQVELQYLRAQRMEGIGLLASGIAHDLNNVLAPVLLSIELLRSMHPDEDTTEILHTVELSARRGADIVRQVLTFARGVKGERIPLQSKHLVKDIVRVAKETFPKDIEVHIRTDLEVANVEGDPTQIHQVLLNLAVNGRDAMPDGGRLTLGAFNRQLTAPLEAVNGTIPPGEYVLLSVTDTGGGIPPQNLIRLFEPFFTTKETNQGTGLGLPTALGIVKSHNGYFRVVSELGKGTEFQVYLPMCFRDGQFTPSPRPAPPRGNGETVLVVDDEAGIRDIASEILSRYGYRVLTASDGTEAVALVAQHRGKIDLVLTDVMMPYMDGVALVRSLRKLAPNLRILAFSGLSNDATLAPKITELRRLGLPPVLSKPIAAPELLSAIHELISAPLPE